MSWWVVGLLLLVAIIAYGGSRVWKSARLVYALGHPPIHRSCEQDGIPYRTEHFALTSCDGLPLAAVHYFPACQPVGCIVAFHYLGGSKQAIYPYVEPLLAAGYSVAAFDYPNHGESGCRKSSRYTLEDDVQRFLAALNARGQKGPVGVMGFSMGATLAIGAAATHPEVKAIVLDSGPLLYVRSYFLHVLHNRRVHDRVVRICFLFWYLFIIGFYRMSWRTKRRLRKLRGLPVLCFHGERDSVIPLRNAQEAYQRIRSENSRLVTVARSHHMTNRALLGRAYDRQVVDFFNRWLKEVDP